MPDPTGADARPADPTETRRSGRAPSSARAAVVLVLALLLVVGVVVTGYLAYRDQNPTADPFDPTAGPVLPSDRERAEVTAVAEQFTLRMDNVDAAEFDTYLKGVSEMLTTKAKRENQQSLEPLKETYQAAKLKGTGKVLAVGVAGLSDDRATVLVAHDAQVSSTQGDIEHHYRWSIDLVKVDGTWLVDDFSSPDTAGTP